MACFVETSIDVECVIFPNAEERGNKQIWDNNKHFSAEGIGELIILFSGYTITSFIVDDDESVTGLLLVQYNKRPLY